MTATQPSPVTPAEIGELLATARTLASNASLAEQTAFFEWKADLLSRIAASFDTPEAHAVAAGARDQAAAIAAKAREASKARP
jgi:hypothetical protein